MKNFPLLRACYLVLFLFIAGTTHAQQLHKVAPEQVGMSGERLGRIESFLDNYTDASQSDGAKLPGTVLLILKNGKIVLEHASGYRDIESKDPMESTDIFRIASQSKAIISTAILILQEEGKLVITAPAGTYLPEFNQTQVAVKTEGGYDVVPAKRRITVRDLLTHTAGIGYGGGPASELWKEAEIQGWYFAHRNEPIRETVRRMAALPMDAQPGDAFVYGYNTDILGAIVEVASGQSLWEFLNERIFTPLNMTDTYFYLPEDKADRLAVVYARDGNSLVRSPEESSMNGQGEYVSGPRKSYSGGAGLLSTANDYARFLQMILNGGELDGVRILSPVSVKSMLSDHISHLGRENGTGFGLGFQVITDPGKYGALTTTGEFSWGGAYHSNYFSSPEYDLVYVYFTQVLPATGLDDHAKLRALVYQSILN